MKEYSFKVEKYDLKMLRHNKNIFNKKKTIFNTYLKIRGTTLNCMIIRTSERFDRKYNSVTEGSYQIDINSIQSIKYKPGYAISLNIHQIILMFTILLSVIGAIYSILHYWSLIINNIITFEILPILISTIGFFLLLSNLTFKCIQITYKDDVVLSNITNKKIVFPVSGIFFGAISKNNKNIINNLVNDLTSINPNIKYKKDKLFKLFIILVLIFLIAFVSVPIVLRQNYLLKNDLSYNLNNNLLYSDLDFEKGTYINVEYDKYAQKYICTFKLQNTGEEIEIDNILNKKVGEVCNIYKINYYRKSDNSLFTTDYAVAYNTSNVGNYTSLGIHYYYDYINNIKFCFNDLNNSSIPTYESLIYYNNSDSTNTLYNFIHSNINVISSFDSFDIQSFKSYNYNSLEKLDNYESKYGNCYIFKAISDNRTDYFMYVENKYNENQKSFDGILINSRISDKSYFSDDATAINSFKYIVNEM